MRIAVIDRDKCKKERCGYQCHRICPGVKMGEETITISDKEPHEGYPLINEELCTGCGICVKKCPTRAINVINLVTEGKTPIFQYGPNSFRLYSLPEIVPGVVGLIGSNGMGKSTALRLLSKRHGRISHKPQNVDRIPDVVQGTVRSLLEKADERNLLETYAARFDLLPILDRDIRHLSGGELQRVAICAASLKAADVYFYDEPSSYLDIEQRLKVAAAIREMGTVLVVEHDIAVLDYLSDYVCIFYGVPGVYGFASRLKRARTGINEYLDGFLREENVRMRDWSITFDVRGSGDEPEGAPLFSWSSFEKRVGDFTLSAEEGIAHTGEVIGILGPNAIGKTTFVNHLAEHAKRSVAYKKQYVRIDEPVTVGEYLSRARPDIRRKLSLDDLAEKPIPTLSGGEMQRVEIARVLSEEASIYLIDEPSAFLDIEQRLAFADFLKSFMMKKEACAFVVDHDLVLLDAIAHRLIVCEGTPARHGHVQRVMSKREGMNRFLARMDVTIRRDKDNKRPRINKPHSQLDREQKAMGEYYYVGV